MEEQANNNHIEIRTLRSDRYVVTIKREDNTWKIFQLAFGADGSLYIHFPYHNDSHGIASIVTLDPGLTYPANNVSLTKQGKVTSHKIKFSHHPTGQVHFSQTGKIFTRIKKQGVPLGDVNGHVFTVMMQNPSWFEQARGKKDDHHHDPIRSVINFNVTGQPDLGYKFVGVWQPFEIFARQLTRQPEGVKAVGPQMVLRLEPSPKVGFLLNPPEGNPMHGYVLLLTIESIEKIDKQNSSVITFIGGFDSVGQVNDMQTPTTFLALMYPTSNPENLIKTIGTIDRDI